MNYTPRPFDIQMHQVQQLSRRATAAWEQFQRGVVSAQDMRTIIADYRAATRAVEGACENEADREYFRILVGTQEASLADWESHLPP